MSDTKFAELNRLMAVANKKRRLSKAASAAAKAAQDAAWEAECESMRASGACDAEYRRLFGDAAQ